MTLEMFFSMYLKVLTMLWFKTKQIDKNGLEESIKHFPTAIRN